MTEREGNQDADKDSAKKTTTTEPGEPGRTPNSAEGDRETIEESLSNQEQKQ